MTGQRAARPAPVRNAPRARLSQEGREIAAVPLGTLVKGGQDPRTAEGFASALDALEVDPASCAYDARGTLSAEQRPRKDFPLTSNAEKAPIHGPGRGGRDRRTAAEYARDLERETAASLRRDPSRWKWRKSNELPKNRSAETEVER